MKKLKVGKKSGLKYFNIQDIRSWKPCYDPNKHLDESFRGTAVDILKNESIPFEDRLWVVLRTDVLSEKVMRLFAVWSYRQTLVFVKNPNPASIRAAEVAELFALGKATQEELSTAWSTAWSAARSARSARSAAWSAVWSAESAAWSAVWSAESAARSAGRSSESTAWSTAWSAVWSDESAAWSAAWSAARSAESAARSAQKEKLIEMIIADAKELRKGRK